MELNKRRKTHHIVMDWNKWRKKHHVVTVAPSERNTDNWVTIIGRRRYVHGSKESAVHQGKAAVRAMRKRCLRAYAGMGRNLCIIRFKVLKTAR